MLHPYQLHHRLLVYIVRTLTITILSPSKDVPLQQPHGAVVHLPLNLFVVPYIILRCPLVLRALRRTLLSDLHLAFVQACFVSHPVLPYLLWIQWEGHDLVRTSHVGYPPLSSLPGRVPPSWASLWALWLPALPSLQLMSCWWYLLGMCFLSHLFLSDMTSSYCGIDIPGSALCALFGQPQCDPGIDDHLLHLFGPAAVISLSSSHGIDGISQLISLGGSLEGMER